MKYTIGVGLTNCQMSTSSVRENHFLGCNVLTCMNIHHNQPTIFM